MLKTRTLTISAMVLILMVLSGCSSPSERARKLHEAGEYEQVLERYPNEPIAERSRIRFAEELVRAGEYERVLAEFPDTPAAGTARERVAARLVEEGKYEEVLTDYRDTPSAMVAREAVARRMFDDGKVDEVAARYPNTEAGQHARDLLANRALEHALQLRGEERLRAFEEILVDPLFAGTPAHAQVHRELARLKGSTKTP